jgi:hypothetical protein
MEADMKIHSIAKISIVAAMFAGSYAGAHHSFSAEFDGQKPIELTGIVTKVEWTNPHVWFYINVKDAESGEVTNWGAEMGPPHGLQRRGWRRTSLQIGEQVTVNGFLARNGSSRVNARNVTLTETGGRPGETLNANSSRQGED